jgi:hypothetical protein
MYIDMRRRICTQLLVSGVKMASIRVMRGKSGFLTAQHTEGEPGCIVQCSTVYFTGDI